MRSAALPLGLASMLLFGTAQAAELVVNGDFAAGSSDWTSSATLPDTVAFASQAVALSGDSATLTQTLSNLVVGGSYDFSFDYFRTAGTGSAIHYDLAGATSLSGDGFGSSSISALVPPYSFTALSNAVTITFNGIAATTAVIDNVTLTGPVAVSAVPEPETYAMLLAGLGAIGLMSRRRRFDS
ncbi:MAG: PEP-CTERM sorting domain-containing protein [Burkholderiales bacterium]